MIKELKIIENQLGRNIKGLHNIETRCKYGFPQVISSCPFIDGYIFPTLYWLTCPYLKKQLDSLEESGMIRELGTKIRESKELSSLYIKETEEYIDRRCRLFKMYFPGGKIPERLSKSGIGGIQNWKEISGIKCLHLHFAYYLVNNDEIIGNMIKDKLSLTCSDNRCLITVNSK